MFKWKPPRDKFWAFVPLVLGLFVLVIVGIAVVRPYRQWKYRQAHPEFYGYPDTTKCPSGTTPSPDGRYILYNDNPCLHSPYGTVVAIYGREEPQGNGTYQTTNAVLNIKSGGPVFVTWKTNRELLIVCRHCREQDVWFIRRRFRDIAIDYRFEGYNEPLPEYITGKRR